MTETQASQVCICVATHADHGYLWNPFKHWRWTPSDRLIYLAPRGPIESPSGCTENWKRLCSVCSRFHRYRRAKNGSFWHIKTSRKRRFWDEMEQLTNCKHWI